MENKIFQAALDKWGLPSQVAMTHGEMGELSTALTQYYVQDKVGPEAVVDEIADVKIMMGQMTLLIESEGGCAPGSVDKRYQEKLERLAGMVDMVYINKDNIEIDHVGPDTVVGVNEIKQPVHLRDYQKTVRVDCHIEPQVKPEVNGRELIMEKWPHAQPLREFMIEHEELMPGSLLVNHHKVDPLKVDNQMILNGELLHWYNMQHWFVIEAPQWEAEKDKAKEEWIDKACVILNYHGKSLFDICERMHEAGFKLPRKELPKETELNLLFSAVSVRARDGGREIANRMYELGYRAPEGGTAKV